MQGIRVYFIGDRPSGGQWGSGNEGDAGRTLEDPLDELYIGGKHTSVRIGWVGEGESEPSASGRRVGVFPCLVGQLELPTVLQLLSGLVMCKS